MSYFSELIDDGTGVLWTGRGVVTGEEVLAGAKTWLSLSPTPERFTHFIADFSGATALEISAEEVLKIGDVDKKNAEVIHNLAGAIVMPTGHGQFLASIYESLNPPGGWTIQVFRTRQEARDWLASADPRH